LDESARECDKDWDFVTFSHLTTHLSECIVAAMKFLSIAFAAMLFSGLALRAADSIYDVPLKDIDGKDTSLKAYQGKVLLIVNVASKCGFTPQYAGLEALYKKYQGQGLVVCGFPCNQFGSQEPGTDEEIKQFCTGKYDVTFPMFDKLEVNGDHRHPLYISLAGKESPFPGNIRWNFTKFLVGRDGKILARFDSKVKPDSAEVTKAVESALAAK
jgi:glutathione peroxidase